MPFARLKPHPIFPTVVFPPLSILCVYLTVNYFHWSSFLFYIVLVVSPFWYLKQISIYRKQDLRRDMYLLALTAEFIQVTLPPILAGLVFEITSGTGFLTWVSELTTLSPKALKFIVLLGVYYLSNDAILKRKETNLFEDANVAGSLLKVYALFFVNILTMFLLPIVFGIIAYYISLYYFGLIEKLSAVIGTIAVIVSYLILLKYLTKGKSKVKRGQEEISFEEARTKIEKIYKKDKFSIPFGNLQLPSESATGHFLYIGTTGSGKTVSMKILMNSVLPLIESEEDHRAVMFDAKRELYAYLYCKLGFDEAKIHTFNPFDKRGVAWDVSKDIDSEAQSVELANALIPPPEKEGDNAYFGKAARRITAGLIYSFILTSDKLQEQGKNRIDWTLRDLILALRYEESIRHLLEKHEETSYLISKYFKNEKTINDVLSTIDTSISDFNVVASLWEHATRKVSLKSWANDKKGSIILLGWDKEHKKSLDPINRLIFQRLSDILINQSNSNTRRNWIFLDELREISGGLNGLTQLLNMGREKGVACVLGVLDIKGLMSSLGENNAQEVTGLCDNVSALRIRSSSTANFLSEMFGNAEVKEQNITKDSQGRRSFQEHITERKTFLSGQFQKLERPSKENGFTIGGYYLNGYTKPYYYDYIGTGLNGWQRFVAKLSESEINTFGVAEREKSEQKLRLWDKYDLQRLCIEVSLEFLTGKDLEQSQEQKEQIVFNVPTPKFRTFE